MQKFRNLKSDVPDNRELAIKVNEIIELVEAQNTGVQRLLKAEIAALIAEIYAINPPRDFSREEVIGYLQRAATSAV